jgi:hypothetical protein
MQNGQQHKKPLLLNPPPQPAQVEQNNRLEKFNSPNALDQAVSAHHNPQLYLRQRAIK